MIGLSQQRSRRGRGGTTLLFKTRPVIPEARTCDARGERSKRKRPERQKYYEAGYVLRKGWKGGLKGLV